MLLCAGSISAQEEGRFAAAALKESEVETFFISFREAIGSSDKKKVASLVSYPIKVTLASGARRTIRNRAEFIRAYDQIFHAEFRKLISKTQVADLWAKSAGVATPRGEIWFSGIGPDDRYTIKIIAINGPMRE